MRKNYIKPEAFKIDIDNEDILDISKGAVISYKRDSAGTITDIYVNGVPVDPKDPLYAELLESALGDVGGSGAKAISWNDFDMDSW